MGLAHGLLRALQLAFFTIVLGIAAFMVSRNDQFHKHDHLASYLTTTGVFGIIAVILGLAAASMSSIAMSVISIVWDCFLAVKFLIGSILLSVAMKPAQCTNDNVYIQYTQTTSWLWRSYDCKYTPMLRALEAFCWLSFISLLATIPLAIKDMQKRRQADINAKSGIPGYPALPQSADRVDRKPKVEEVVEVV